MRGKWERKLAASLLGAFVALAVLELLLRAGSFAFVALQEKDNRKLLGSGDRCRIMCLGESTTAMGGQHSYPSLLHRILNERAGGARFSVINRGIPGSHTAIILSRAERDIDEYRPDIVVAMMGANDRDGAVPWEDIASGDDRRGLNGLKSYRLMKLALYHASRADRRQPAEPRSLRISAETEEERLASGFDPVRTLLERGLQKDAEDYIRKSGITLTSRERLAMSQILLFSSEGAVGELRRRLAGMVGATPAFDAPEVRRIIEPLMRGEGGACDEALSRLTGDGSDRARALFIVGDTLFMKRRPWEARLAFMRSALLNPRLARAHVEVGRSSISLGELAPAEAALKRALELEPPDGASLNQPCSPIAILSEVYVKQRKAGELDALFTWALERAPLEDLLADMAASCYRRLGDAGRAEHYARKAAELRAAYFHPMTRRNYLRLEELLRRRGIALVSMQYPTRSVEPLKKLLSRRPGVVFVDNEGSFREALARRGYDALFSDRCYITFGHGTAEGNRLLAENAAEAILKGCVKLAR